MFWPFFLKVLIILLIEVVIGQMLYSLLFRGKESKS
jgi:Tfp pilus assembly protein PilO